MCELSTMSHSHCALCVTLTLQWYTVCVTFTMMHCVSRVTVHTKCRSYCSWCVTIYTMCQFYCVQCVSSTVYNVSVSPCTMCQFHRVQCVGFTVHNVSLPLCTMWHVSLPLCTMCHFHCAMCDMCHYHCVLSLLWLWFKAGSGIRLDDDWIDLWTIDSSFFRALRSSSSSFLSFSCSY